NDTAAFAVESIRQWWYQIGKQSYPDAKEILITADCGGSNGYRVRLWKLELQKFADELGLPISVSHFPPGTSKWNKIEHRLFSFITKNWRGKPLTDYVTIVELIAATKTNKGLKVCCRLDKKSYPKGIKISDEELNKIKIKSDEFHGDWNYTIMPRNIESL
ncbi:MAG: ISAzo13 family transposase, partial [Bacteroidota bacterium]